MEACENDDTKQHCKHRFRTYFVEIQSSRFMLIVKIIKTAIELNNAEENYDGQTGFDRANST